MDAQAFNQFSLRAMGYLYSKEMVVAVLDDAILEGKEHTFVKNRLLDMLGEKDKSFDECLNSNLDTRLLELDLGMSDDEKRRRFVSGFEDGIKDYLRTLTAYLSKT